MAYCRYCGNELINGQCSCREFQISIGTVNNIQHQEAYKQKTPFIIPSFKPNFSSFSGFWSSLRDLSGMSEPTNSSNNPYERNIPIVPNCIQPEDNEVVVKQYNVAKLRTRLKFMRAEGRLMVTNRRILFRATGTSLTGNIVQEHQFNLDEIGGIEIHKDYKFSFLSFFGSLFICLLLNIQMLSFSNAMLFSRTSNATIAIGVILGIVGLLPTFIVYSRFWLKLLCAIIANGCFSMALATSLASGGNGILILFVIFSGIIVFLNLVLVCFVPNLVIKIKTKGAVGAMVIGSQKSIFKRKAGDDYSGFAEVLPWEDTIMAMNELGTMIDDLQKQGDYAIEKWTNF